MDGSSRLEAAVESAGHHGSAACPRGHRRRIAEYSWRERLFIADTSAPRGRSRCARASEECLRASAVTAFIRASSCSSVGSRLMSFRSKVWRFTVCSGIHCRHRLAAIESNASGRTAPDGAGEADKACFARFARRPAGAAPREPTATPR